MKATRSLLIFFALSLLLTSYADASLESEQLIQDYDFSSSSNYAYWGIYKGVNPTTNSNGDPVSPAFNVILDNSNKWAEIYSTQSGPNDVAWGYDEWAYIYQKVAVPNVNIVNATLSFQAYSHWPYMTVKLEHGLVSQPDRNHWIQYTSVPYKDGTFLYSLNVTSTLQRYEGRNVTVMLGVYMPSSSPLQNGNTRIYWVKLNIQYNGTGTGGSGGGSSGGDSWWGGGGYWHGNGGSWSGSGGGWWSGGGGWWSGGGGWFARSGSANQTYVEYVAGNIQKVLSIVGMSIIAVLWTKVGLDYFSDDPDKKAKAKEDSLLAFIATLIIAVAVLGAMWMIAGWMIGATQIIWEVIV